MGDMPSMYGASSGQGRILSLLDLEEVAYVMTSKTGVEIDYVVLLGLNRICK